jgi:acyl-coenzyme A synthetase/AMP-(fatty) acid ligase
MHHKRLTFDKFRTSWHRERHLAHFKAPQKLHFVPELPKTATGKVQKYVLRGKPAISKQ